MKKRVMILGMSPNVGGVETYIMNCIRNIDRDKYEFYCPFYTTIAYHDELLELGVKLLRIQASRHNPIHYIRYLDRLFTDLRFEAVYFNTCDIMSMDMIMFGKKHGVPIRIIHSHNSSNIVEPNLFHRFTEKWCRNHLDEYATKLLACSEVAGDWMFDGRKFEIINNGIDATKFRFNSETRLNTRKELGLTDQYTIGFVGSIWEQKNPLFLIEVFRSYYKKNPNAILIIVGDGELKGEVEKKIGEYGLSANVKLLGVRSDIPDLMSAMDCFLLPSKFEGLPFVLIEAQCSGLMCIASENVSQESNITGEVRYLGLDEPMEKWIEAISTPNVRLPREEYASIISCNGYDIKGTVKRLEEILG